MFVKAARKRVGHFGAFLATSLLVLATGAVGVVGTVLLPEAATAAPGPAAAVPGLQCIGDGTSGHRVQMLYVYEPGHNRLADRERAIRLAAWETQQNVNDSARQQGGQRWVRWQTTSNCALDITSVEVPAGTGAADNLAGELRPRGFDWENRIYAMYFENHVADCASGDVPDSKGDTTPGEFNKRNSSTGWLYFSPGCFNGHTMTHELAHVLGGVLDGAPNKDAGNHCTDGYETLCQPQSGDLVCPDPMNVRMLDCGHDDYFAVDPQGSYLPTHFNAATDSKYLEHGGAVPPMTVVSPLPPQNLRAVDVQGTSVALTFTPSSYPARGNLRYELLVDGEPRTSVSDADEANDFRVTGLAPRTTYFFSVRSVYEADGEKRYSEPSVRIVLVTGTSTTIAPDVNAGGDFVFTNELREGDSALQTLENGRSQDEDSNIFQHPRNRGDNQTWRAASAGNGNITLRSLDSGKCLAVKDGFGGTGAPLVQKTCASATAQRWFLASTGDGATYLKSAQVPSLCVRPENGDSGRFTNLVLDTCSAADPGQRWTAHQIA